MLTQICSEVQTSVDAGITTRNDLLQVKLRQNELKSNLLNLDNNLKLSYMVLSQYIGLNGEEIAVVPEEQMDAVPSFPSELAVDHATALLNTPEYKLLDRNVRANRLQKRLAVGKNLPSVGAGVGYMYDNLMDKDHPFGVAYVTVSVPLSGWWGGSHAIKQQKAKLDIAQNTLSDSSDLLIIQMRHLWNEVEDAYQQLLIARDSEEQSTENLRLNRNYYQAGMSTMSDLLDAQSLFQQSRDQWTDSYSQFKIKVLEYCHATGQR
jgi:outer membrane protein TolC